jgi:hypothetical protein
MADQSFDNCDILDYQTMKEGNVNKIKNS